MKIIYNIFHYLLFFLVYITLGIIFSGKHTWILLLLQLSILAYTFVYFKKNILKKLKFSLVILLSIFVISAFMTNEYSRLGAYLIFIPITFGLSLYSLRKKWIIPVLLVFIVFNSIVGYPNFFQFVESFRNPDIKNVDINQPSWLNEDQKEFQFDNSKTYVLDFWYVGCSQCYKNFPKFKELSKAYKSENIEFLSVFVPFQKDRKEEYKTLKKILDYYKFETIIANESNQMESILKIDGYPNYMIIKNNKVFDSHINISEDYVYFNNLKYKLSSL